MNAGPQQQFCDLSVGPQQHYDLRAGQQQHSYDLSVGPQQHSYDLRAGQQQHSYDLGVGPQQHSYDKAGIQQRFYWAVGLGPQQRLSIALNVRKLLHTNDRLANLFNLARSYHCYYWLRSQVSIAFCIV